MRSLRPLLVAAALTAALPSPEAAGSVDCLVLPRVDDRCELWTATFDSPAGHGPAGAGFDYATAMAVGRDSVFVTGSSWDEAEATQHIATVAFSQEDGSQRWEARAGNGEISYPYAIAVSPDRTLVTVTGASDYDFATKGDLVTITYDAASGIERWSSTETGAGLSAGYAAAVGTDGTVYVTGSDRSDAITVALDGGSGEKLWQARLDGPGHGEDQGRQVAVSADGSVVFVAGIVGGSGTDWDYLIAAYAAVDDLGTAGDERGRLVWSATYDGNHEMDIAYGLGVSPDGSRVFVTGESAAEGRGVRQNVDYATVALDAATGERLWARRYSGPLRGENLAFDLALSPSGDRVYVTGQGTGEGTDLDWEVTTVAYDAATGTEDWTRRYGFPPPCIEWGQAVAATAGAVYVAGVSSANCFQIDLVTLRLDAATGTPEWVARFNDSGVANDWPVAVGLSDDGSRVFTAALFSDKGVDPTSQNLDDYGLVAYET